MYELDLMEDAVLHLLNGMDFSYTLLSIRGNFHLKSFAEDFERILTTSDRTESIQPPSYYIFDQKIE